MKSYQEIFDQALLMCSYDVNATTILTYIATESEKLLDADCAVSILLLDKGSRLRNASSPKLPSDYLAAIDGIKPDPNVGTCAAAVATRNIVITPSFLADNKWSELKHLPMSIGYAGAWSVPIVNNQNIALGTIGVYNKTIKSPNEVDISGIQLLCKAAAHILTQKEKANLNG